MVVADSSLPRRSSSAHRICIRATGRAERLPASTPAPALALQPPAGQNAGRPSPLLAAIRPRRGRPRGDATAAGTVYYAKRHSTRPPCPHTHTHERRGSASASDGVMLVSCAWFQARSMVICDGCYIQPWCRSFALASDVSGPSLAAHQGSAPAPAEPAPRLILLLHILNTSDGGGRRPQTGATIGSSLIGNSNALRRPVAGRSL